MSRVFPPVVDVLLRQAAALTAYLRSAHTGSVVLLAAALLLPFAQTGHWLGAVTQSVRTSTSTALDQANPVQVAADLGASIGAGSHKASRSFAPHVFGLPPELLGSPGAGPERVPGTPVPEEASRPLPRRDLERGPPFFL